MDYVYPILGDPKTRTLRVRWDSLTQMASLNRAVTTNIALKPISDDVVPIIQGRRLFIPVA